MPYDIFKFVSVYPLNVGHGQLLHRNLTNLHTRLGVANGGQNDDVVGS